MNLLKGDPFGLLICLKLKLKLSAVDGVGTRDVDGSLDGLTANVRLLVELDPDTIGRHSKF